MSSLRASSRGRQETGFREGLFNAPEANEGRFGESVERFDQKVEFQRMLCVLK